MSEVDSQFTWHVNVFVLPSSIGFWPNSINKIHINQSVKRFWTSSSFCGEAPLYSKFVYCILSQYVS